MIKDFTAQLVRFGIWPPRKKAISAGIVFLCLILIIGCFVFELGPVAGNQTSTTKNFEIKQGDSFREIASRLASEHLIRSRIAFEFLSLFTGTAGKLKPGIYELNQTMSASKILDELVSGVHREITVMIPEDASVYEINKILSDAGAVSSGALVNFNSENKIEGKLFPDTYNFFKGSDAKDVVQKFLANFEAKAAPALANGGGDAGANLILASLVEKEVPEYEDQQIVAGIILKRLKAGMPLQVDATVCYTKAVLAYPAVSPCYPLTPLDFKRDSPYNTYLHAGLPPGPIGNPGLSAINAVLDPKSSPYWFYLSDPATYKTVFAKTLDEQSANRAKYLKQ